MSRTVLIALLALAVRLPLNAQQQMITIQQPPGGPPGAVPMMPPRDVPQKPGTARIRGRVVAAETGLPLRKAQVRAVAPELRENRATSTDADGRFELKELPAGRYNVSASKGSFVSLQFGQLRPFTPGKPIELKDGETIEKVDFALPRGAIITGRVVDEFGEPIADVQVAAMHYQYIQGRRRLVPAGGRPMMTNDIGEYRIFALPPGQYYLSATLRGGMMMMGDSDDRSGYAPTYYPGTSNIAEAQRISVGIGQTVNEMNVSLMPARTARVSGIALDSSGKPMSGGFIMAMQTMSGGAFGFVMSTGGGQIKPDGTFSVSGLAPGEYTLRANPVGGLGEFAEFASAHVTVNGEDVTGVQLAAAKPVTVVGRIIVPPGQTFQTSGARIMTSPADPNEIMFGPPGGGKVNDDLTFELKVPPGRVLVRLLARTSGDWTTRAERLNGVDVTDAGIEVRAGDEISGLEIEVTNQQSQLLGTVRDGRGALMKDYSVVVFARDRERWSYPQSRYVKTGQPDQDGRFKITDLPAGDYYAVALDTIDQGEASDPEFLERIKDRATPFSLGDGEAKSLDLKISTSG